MEKNLVMQKIKETFNSELGIDISAIQPQCELKKDLKINSIDMADLLLNLEDDYGVSFTDDEVKDLLTVEDLAALLVVKL